MRKGWIILGIFVLLAAGAFVYPLVATAQDDVGFCLTCHVMAGQGESWQTSFHRKEATCSDCHTISLVQKYTDGAHHLFANITGAIPDPIKIKESSRQVVAANCAACHNPTSLHSRTKQQKNQNCLECHKGHDPKAVHVNALGK